MLMSDECGGMCEKVDLRKALLEHLSRGTEESN
jgi:hypothetical protein